MNRVAQTSQGYSVLLIESFNVSEHSQAALQINHTQDSSPRNVRTPTGDVLHSEEHAFQPQSSRADHNPHKWE